MVYLAWRIISLSIYMVVEQLKMITQYCSNRTQNHSMIAFDVGHQGCDVLVECSGLFSKFCLCFFLFIIVMQYDEVYPVKIILLAGAA